MSEITAFGLFNPNHHSNIGSDGQNPKTAFGTGAIASSFHHRATPRLRSGR